RSVGVTSLQFRLANRKSAFPAKRHLGRRVIGIVLAPVLAPAAAGIRVAAAGVSAWIPIAAAPSARKADARTSKPAAPPRWLIVCRTGDRWRNGSHPRRVAENLFRILVVPLRYLFGLPRLFIRCEQSKR